MDVWLITNKVIIMLFIIFSILSSHSTNIPWIVFSLLLYVSINLSIYIVKNRHYKQSAHIGSMLIIGLSAYAVHPFLIFLFSINVFELLSSHFLKKWVVFGIALLPLVFIKENLFLSYGLITSMSFLFFLGMSNSTKRLEVYEQQLDKMRHDLQKLSKSMNENNEFLKQSQYTIKLEERNRISQEIHDSIGHAMTGALIQMEASKRLIGMDQTKAMELLQNAIHISKDGIEKIRLTLKNMKPPAEQMGIHRIKLALDEFSAKNDIQTVFVYKGNTDLITPIQWKIIHENLIESLTNMLKYSNGTNASLELNVLNKFIRFEVKDNGSGAEKIKKGLGIMGMEERTAAVNGTIIVDGSNGFSVTTLLPRQ